MTPRDVRAFREAVAISSGAPYGQRDLSRIIDRASALPQIEALCREVEAVLLGFPDLRRVHGYGWASDPDSYDVPVDAALQRRILLMLGKHWVESGPSPGLADRTAGIVAIQGFSLRIDASSPRISPPKAPWMARSISIPAGFVEFGTWFFATLRCWTSSERGNGYEEPDDGGWSLMTTPTASRPPMVFDHVGTRELVARTLAAEVRDEGIDNLNAALLIRERVPELAGRGGDLDPAELPHFDQNAAYMLVEFALAHELGHALASPVADAFDFADRELDADRTGLALIAMTSATRAFGWRDATVAPWTQAALGLALFCLFVDCRLALVDGLLRRDGLAFPRREISDDGRIRAVGARRDLDRLVHALASSSSVPTEDAQRVAALLSNADAFVRDLRRTVAALPNSVVERGLAVARASLGETPC